MIGTLQSPLASWLPACIRLFAFHAKHWPVKKPEHFA